MQFFFDKTVEMRGTPECDTENEPSEDTLVIETETDTTVIETETELGAVKEDIDKDIERNKSAESFYNEENPLTPLFDKIPIHVVCVLRFIGIFRVQCIKKFYILVNCFIRNKRRRDNEVSRSWKLHYGLFLATFKRHYIKIFM